MSCTISRSVVPIGTSTRPVLVTLPTTEKTFVPLLDSVPMEENHSPPRLIITGTFAHVSTLLIFVGLLHRPDWAGKGGRIRGSGVRPSSDAISDVSSPQTNAPAPRCTLTSKLKPLPKMSSPKSPYSRAWSMAICRRFIARGYSSRIYM